MHVNPNGPRFLWITIVTWHFANRMTLITFATVCLRGVVSGAEFPGTIRAALLAGAAFYCLGAIVGEIAKRAVEESVTMDFEKLLIAELEAKAEPQTSSESIE